MTAVDLAAAWDHAQHVAEQWAGRGIPAFPIAISHDPTKYDGTGGLNKRPLTEHGHLDATTNPDELAVLFADARRRARPGEQPGAGLCPGPAGYVQIDIDLKGGHNGYIAAANLGLQDTWGAKTPSGGEHRMWRKPDPTKWVGNSSPWAGIDIRSDAGWTVAPGTQTTWGAWSRNDIDDAQRWPDDVHTLPPSIWGRLDLHDTAPAVTHTTAQHQRQLNDHLAATLHPDTLAAWEHLRDHHGAHSALWNAAEGRTWLLVTRPGKRGWGASTYIGSREHGQIWNLSSSWPGVAADTALYLVNGQLVDQTAWHTHQLDQWAPDTELEDDEPAVAYTEVLDRAARTNPDNDNELAGAILHEIRRQRARELAQIAIANSQPETPFDDGTLANYEPKPISWRIEDVLPAEGRALIVAQHKTGKTTIALNIARTLITGEPFLGKYPTTPIEGRVGYLNYEVSGGQFTAWAAEANLAAEDRIYLNNLRGHPNPFGTERAQQRLVDRLTEHNVTALIIDPFRRAFHGDDPDKTGQVNRWTELVDRLAHEANINEVIVLHHTGHDTERLRNSSALADWPDTILTLTRNDQGNRFISGIGRDVDIEEDELHFDPWRRALTLTGKGGRKRASAQSRRDNILDDVVKVINEHHDSRGISGNGIEAALKAKKISFSKGDGAELGRVAASRGLVYQDSSGTNAVWKPLPPEGSRHLPTPPE